MKSPTISAGVSFHVTSQEYQQAKTKYGMELYIYIYINSVVIYLHTNSQALSFEENSLPFARVVLCILSACSYNVVILIYITLVMWT